MKIKITTQWDEGFMPLFNKSVALIPKNIYMRAAQLAATLMLEGELKGNVKVTAEEGLWIAFMEEHMWITEPGSVKASIVYCDRTFPSKVGGIIVKATPLGYMQLGPRVERRHKQAVGAVKGFVSYNSESEREALHAKLGVPYYRSGVLRSAQ